MCCKDAAKVKFMITTINVPFYAKDLNVLLLKPEILLCDKFNSVIFLFEVNKADVSVVKMLFSFNVSNGRVY